MTTPVSDRARLLTLVVGFGLAACVIGLVAAVAWNAPVMAQRGGAVAVALTFAMLFLGRATPERALETDPPAGLPGIDAEARPVSPATASRAAEAALDRVRNALAAGSGPDAMRGPLRTLHVAERLCDLSELEKPADPRTRAARGGVATARALIADRLGADAAERLETLTALDVLRDRSDATRAALTALLDWQNREKWRLALLSVAGTLMAGFGDALARALGAQASVACVC